MTSLHNPADLTTVQSLLEHLAYMGPKGLGVFIDDGVANENTVLGIDGLESNPVSTIVAATTIAAALGSQRFYLINDSQITLAQTYEGHEFIGIGIMNQITLGSQDVDNSHFEGLILTGTQGGSQFMYAMRCQLQSLLGVEIIACECEVTGNITLRVATNQTFRHCVSAVPGGATPVLIFPGAGGATTVNWRHYSGGLTVKDARLNDVMSYEADGQFIIDASCTSFEVHIRGMVSPITDNGTTSVIIKTAAIDDIGQEVYEIEHHLHNRERWFGISGDQSGNDWAVAAGLTPFVAASGDGAFGTAIKILGTDDTPAIAGMTKFDPHRILVVAEENATPWVLRLIWGTGTSGDAESAGQYTDVMIVANIAGPPVRPNGMPIPLKTGRLNAGADRLWLRVKNATDADELNFFIGVHEYTR